MILADNETSVDFINYEAIAETMVDLLRSRPDEAVTLGVHGDWGAGKSSILEMVARGFESDGRTLVLRFNGWRFQGFEDAKIALIEGIVAALLEAKPEVDKESVAVRSVLRRLDYLKIAKHVGQLALPILTGGVTLPAQIEAAKKKVQAALDSPSETFTVENATTALKEAMSYLKPVEEAAKPSIPQEVAEFHEAFDALLEEADVDRLIVLVDDLDRCLPETAVATLEAIRLFVFTNRTAFVIAADEQMIEYSVRKHFPDLPATSGPQTYARNYLEKLIQVPFRLPAMGTSEVRIYVTLLLSNAGRDLSDQEFASWVDEGRSRLRRPWLSDPLDVEAASKVWKDGPPDCVRNAIAISDQIAPMLAQGTEGNPRQVKRFLNALLLRESAARARGFAEDIERRSLAKIMLLEQFLPARHDQFMDAAAVDPDGVCRDLADAEALLFAKDAPVRTDEDEAAGKQGDGSPDKPTVPEPVKQLVDDQNLVGWMRLSPSLGLTDLRPYGFVARDRRDYLGAPTALGHLKPLFERLKGSKFAVAGLGAELDRLTQEEAVRLFNALREYARAANDLQTEPAGMAGIRALVEKHPSLQSAFVTFYDALPSGEVGVWVLNGVDRLVPVGAERPRLIAVVKRWHDSGSPILRTASKQTLNLLQGGS